MLYSFIVILDFRFFDIISHHLQEQAIKKLVIIILQNTENISKRKTASKNIFTSQTIPYMEPKIAHSGWPIVPLKYLTSFKLKFFEQI